MKVIVNDANVLIDLIELNLLPNFFSLKFEFLTTDLVLAELFEEQYQSLIPYIYNGTLIVRQMMAEDLIYIYQIRTSKPTLSEQDCSAFYQARQNAAILITSDNKLRVYAKEQQIEVHGHLWIFDHMMESGTINGSRAIQKLLELSETVNPKLGLPRSECDRRIKRWKKC